MTSCMMNTIKRQSSHLHGCSRIALRLLSTTQARAHGKTPSVKDKAVSSQNCSNKMIKMDRITHEVTFHITTSKRGNQRANNRREIALLDATPDLNFYGNIIIEPRSCAIAKALEISQFHVGHQHLILYVDGSRITKPSEKPGSSTLTDGSIAHSGAGVVYKPSDGDQSWQVRYFISNNGQDSVRAELAAIANGLAHATTLMMLSKGQDIVDANGATAHPKVTIFTDCTSALYQIERLKKPGITKAQLRDEPIACKLVTRSQYLRHMGAELELLWSPGHSQIEGNTRANKAAQYAAKNQNMGVLIDEGLRLIQIKIASRSSQQQNTP